MLESRLNVGDLVRLHDIKDPGRQIGIIVAVSPRMAHVVSHGRTNVVQVYWPAINETDWEYDFFLAKIEENDLTKDKK